MQSIEQIKNELMKKVMNKIIANTLDNIKQEL